MTPSRFVMGPELLPKEKAKLRLGLQDHPLGPPIDPGYVQAGPFYDAILSGRPYLVKALVLFGSDPLIRYGDVLHGKEAFTALDFYIHMDVFANPTSSFADLLLPASTPWESEALKPSFALKDSTQEAAGWAQLRKSVVPPLASTRSDLSVIFDLARRLGLGKHFFDGDIEKAWRYQLEPSSITLEQLRAHPIGVKCNVVTQYRKYAAVDPSTGIVGGFPTPSRKLELYSARFAAAGYDPLPSHSEPAESPIGTSELARAYPLILTSFRHLQLVDQQHRNIPRLRRAVPEPIIEIHPGTAAGLGIVDGDWVNLETLAGKIRLKAKYNDALNRKSRLCSLRVVAGMRRVGSLRVRSVLAEGGQCQFDYLERLYRSDQRLGAAPLAHVSHYERRLSRSAKACLDYRTVLSTPNHQLLALSRGTTLRETRYRTFSHGCCCYPIKLANRRRISAVPR